jgi:hypothetical protein
VPHSDVHERAHHLGVELRARAPPRPSGGESSRLGAPSAARSGARHPHTTEGFGGQSFPSVETYPGASPEAELQFAKSTTTVLKVDT